MWDGWTFDPITALVTALILPLLYLLRMMILSHLKQWLQYLVEGVMYWISRSIKKSVAAALTLKQYSRLRLADEKYRYLIVPSTINLNLDIERVFVPLTIENPSTPKTSYDHNDLLTVGTRIRVLGDPGSGKSSLIKKIFRDACRKCRSSPRTSRLPVLLELKNLPAPPRSGVESGSWMYNYLKGETSKCAVYKMEDCFDNYASTTGLLVLLDGLDEVSTSDYAYIKKAINALSEDLSNRSPNNNVILTMRTQFHQQTRQDFPTHFPHVTLLRSFSPKDIYEFLARWPFEKHPKKNITRIYKELTDRLSLRELCGNPLILAMYVAADQKTGHVAPPDSRTEFYRKVTEELIIKRRLHQRGPTVAPTKLREQRERILGRLAYEHLTEGVEAINLLRWSEGLKVVCQILGCSPGEAEGHLRELAKETGLIGEEQPQETFRFIHLSLCEFLAALEAIQAREDGWNRLVATHQEFKCRKASHVKSRLVEVLPFACGLLPRVDRFQALLDVQALNDTDLLARCFLETKSYEHTIWAEFISSAANSLLQEPEKNWNEQWLRRLHLFNVVAADANLCSVHMASNKAVKVDLETFYKSLIVKQKESLSVLLGAYASRDAAAAFRLAELSKLDLAENFPEIVISNCDQPPFFALVLEQMERETGRLELWSSLLCEAALRSRAVAHQLNTVGSWRSLSDRLKRITAKRRWALGSRETLYTKCLSIATGTKSSSPAARILHLVRQLPAPGSHRLFFLGSRVVYFLVFLVLLVLLVLSFSPGLLSTQEDGSLFRSFTIIYLALFLLVYLWLLRRIGLIIAYREVLFPSEDQGLTRLRIIGEICRRTTPRNIRNLVDQISRERTST